MSRLYQRPEITYGTARAKQLATRKHPYPTAKYHAITTIELRYYLYRANVELIYIDEVSRRQNCLAWGFTNIGRVLHTAYPSELRAHEVARCIKNDLKIVCPLEENFDLDMHGRALVERKEHVVNEAAVFAADVITTDTFFHL